MYLSAVALMVQIVAVLEGVSRVDTDLVDRIASVTSRSLSRSLLLASFALSLLLLAFF